MWFLDFFVLYFGKYGISLLFYCNFLANDIFSFKNEFILSIFCAWANYSFKEPIDDFGSQIPWNYAFIKINGTTAFDKILHQAGEKLRKRPLRK